MFELNAISSSPRPWSTLLVAPSGLSSYITAFKIGTISTWLVLSYERIRLRKLNSDFILISYHQVLEYMGGGDLLNLLIERDVFEEDFTRFYVAEVRILVFFV